MKVHKIFNIVKGQVSLELIILILATILGAVVAGVTLNNIPINITSVEDSKGVVFEGFIKGGGTPVYTSGGNGSSNNNTTESGSGTDSEDNNEESGSGTNTGDTGSDSNTNEESGSDTNTGDTGSDSNTIGGGRIENLELSIKGRAMVNLTSKVIPDGKPLPENKILRYHGKGVSKYNVKGNIIDERKIIIRGNRKLYLGNLSEIDTLTCEIGGIASLTIEGSTINISNIDKIGGSATLTIKNTTINMSNISKIRGSASLTIEGSTINISNIDEIRGSATLTIKNTTIDTLNINKITTSYLIIENSVINTLNIGTISYASIIIKNSIINNVVGIDITKCYIENSTIEGQKYD